MDDNALNFSGQLRNVNLEALSGFGMGMAAVVIDHAELSIISHGGFEKFALSSIANFLLRTTNPDAEVAAAKQRVTKGILENGDFLGPESQDALIRLIADLPHPKGVFRLKTAPKEGYALFRLGALATATKPEDVFGDMNLSFEYLQSE